MKKEEIVKFFMDNRKKCSENCPFFEECQLLYYHERESTTNARDLCDAIIGIR